MTKYVLSFGAGVNSTALLIWLLKNKKPLDLVIFADTKNEFPETYENVQRMSDWCMGHGIEFSIVSSGNLMEEYSKNRVIPLRMFRSCTDKFKIRPIKKYLKARFEGEKIVTYLGIDYGESHRARPIPDNEYPLVENRIDRDGCIDIIKSEGLEVPIKSGCFYCPFQARSEWKSLYEKNKELFDKAVEFEENNRKFPDLLLGQHGQGTLRNFANAIKTQTKIKRFIIDEEMESVGKCAFCHS